MSIDKLTTLSFRNLTYQQTELHSQFNFIIGDNGSGKSSFLEAIFYLGHGKSFRTSKIDNLVTLEQTSFVISVKDEKGNQFGVSRNCQSNDIEIKINDIKYHKLSELAKGFAVQIVTPESFKLFFGGPRERRKFIDLGLFHVKQSFPEQWKHFSRVLKQRNACLKARKNSNDISYWNEQFCLYAEDISLTREQYFRELKEELIIWLDILVPALGDNIVIHYFRGWNSKRELRELIQEAAEREYHLGHSLYGPQKFDVRFTIDGIPVENKLSRGQQKLFLLALTLAQSKLIEKVEQVKPILLIDDIGAELDINSRTLLADALANIDCQIIITAIEESVLLPITQINNNFKMFHVKHGKLSAISE